MPHTLTISQSIDKDLSSIPEGRSVVCLMRHAAREDLVKNDMELNRTMPITPEGRKQATDLGASFGDRLVSIHSSPINRCVETCECVKRGAGFKGEITVNNRLAGPGGAYMTDDNDAAKTLGQCFGDLEKWHALVTSLYTTDDDHPGMVSDRRVEAYKFISELLALGNDTPGIHLFCSHDFHVLLTASFPLGTLNLTCNFLDRAFFWIEEGQLHTLYREQRTTESWPVYA